MRALTQQSIEEARVVSGDIEIVSIPIHTTGVYTLSEAAELTKCSYSTIRRAVESGNLAASSIGNQPRIIGSKLLEWIESGGVTGRSKATM
ncbi:MAG: helix-turn-helix domain-containing protein [Blastocatellales bacterium]